MWGQVAARALGLGLILLAAVPASAEVTADLTLSLRAWLTDSRRATRLDNLRLLADAEVGRSFRFHLDLDRQAPTHAELYELSAEWASAGQRVLAGRFQVPFGIYNRSELYYSGLINNPIIKYYPASGPKLGRSEHGLGYVGVAGEWQIELGLFAQRGGARTLAPSGGEGSIRVQHFLGPLILGVSGMRGHATDPANGRRGAAHWVGLDFRYSRPELIARGEWATGHVPGESPRGFYLDLLYHPATLHVLTFVGRTEGVQGQSLEGNSAHRQTIGIKWDVGGGTSLAVNQSFDSSRRVYSLDGTTVFLWYIHRL
jgi:hypothetical protein